MNEFRAGVTRVKQNAEAQRLSDGSPRKSPCMFYMFRVHGFSEPGHLFFEIKDEGIGVVRPYGIVMIAYKI